MPDTTSKINFTDNDTKFNTQGIQFIINPYDELALTKALELTEKHGGEVTIINVGKADTEAQIRKALAVGAQKAVRIDAEPSNSYFVAEQIANYAKDKNYDLILTGRESIDYNGGIVCGLIGEMLSIPSINVITQLEIEGNTATMIRDIDGGKETIKCNLPLVASAQKDLTEPRLPNMRGIMAARTKPLEIVPAMEENSLVSFEKYELPEPKKGCKMIDANNAEELIELLHNEAKVI